MFNNINKSGIEDIQKLYKDQCPAIYNKGMNDKYGLLTTWVIGKSTRFEYLQCLVDS